MGLLHLRHPGIGHSPESMHEQGQRNEECDQECCAYARTVAEQHAEPTEDCE
jgi:hypothetical protein